MKEEKENLLLKFLSFFVGPIQFVMEVSFFDPPDPPAFSEEWRSIRNETSFQSSLSDCDSLC